MKFLHALIKKNWPLIVIGGLWIILVLANYRLNTWLIGWDSLVPELDFSLNIKRSLVGTWQEYQGLGIAGGMAHNADLVRQLFLWLSSVIIPQEFLRYSWHFLMLLVGPIGVYFLIKKILNLNLKLEPLTGALFYLFNLATVQYFFVPYEAFSSFYGFLPWVLLSFTNYLDKPKIKNLLFFFLVFLLSTPAYYVQTLFVTLFICLFIFSTHHILSTPSSKTQALKTNLKAYLIILIASLFWIIPTAHFTLSSANNTIDSQQNQLSTPEISLQNQGFGSLFNVMRLKGFWFSYTDQDLKNQQTTLLFEKWQLHIDQPVMVAIEVALFVLSFFGLLIASKEKGNKWLPASLSIFLLSLIMLTGGNGLLGIPYQFLSKGIPLFAQIFRTSFTKWSIVTVLFMSLGVSLFVKKFKDKKITQVGVITLIIVGSLSVISPMFSGELINKQMANQLPKEYLSLFDHLKNQDPSKRIVHLPSPDIWGWQLNNWDYRGSGFLWYGIEQPIIDRNFDAWGPSNEQAYRELEHALSNFNSDHLKQVLNKYDISYVLIDKSIISPNNDVSIKQIGQNQQQLINLGGQIEWEQDNLTLINISDLVDSNKNIFVPHQITIVNSSTPASNWDPIYNNFHDYVMSDQTASVSFPFVNLSGNQLPSTDEAVIKYVPPLNMVGDELVIPALDKDRDYFTGPVKIIHQPGLVEFEFLDLGKIKLNETEINLPKPNDFSFEIPAQMLNLVIGINNLPTHIPQGESQMIWLEGIKIGSKIEIIYFNQEDSLEEESQIIVNKNQAFSNFAPDSIWQPLLTNFSHKISEDSPSIELMIATQQFDLTDLIKNSKSTNCDIFNRGLIAKTVTEENIIYQADNFATLCEAVVLDETLTIHDYWLNMTGINQKGRSLKFFVENKESNHVILEKITPDNSYSQTHALNSDPGLKSSNFILNLNSRSSGGEQSKNSLSYILLNRVPISFNWLQQIHFKKNQPIINNHVFIDQIKKIGTGLYLSNIKVTESDLSGIIALNQSFDRGWIAINKTNPFKPFHHYEFNGWANAWEVPAGEYQITIFYWPQLLVWGGYIILIGTGAYLVVKTLKDKKK